MGSYFKQSHCELSKAIFLILSRSAAKGHQVVLFLILKEFSCIYSRYDKNSFRDKTWDHDGKTCELSAKLWQLFTFPSIPIPQSAAWIMLTSFPPSPDTALEEKKNKLLAKSFFCNVDEVDEVLKEQQTGCDCHLVDTRSTRSYFPVICLSSVCGSVWACVCVFLSVFKSYLSSACLCFSTNILFHIHEALIHTSNRAIWQLSVLLKGTSTAFLPCKHSPMAQVLLAVCCCRSRTIWAFWVGEQRQQTTAGHWHASSTNSCS